MESEKGSANEEVPIDYQFVRVLIGIALVLITLVLYAVFKRGKSVRRNLLLTGTTESGKTLIFSQFIHGTYIDTHTSMKENVGDLTTEKGIFKLIDIPGYERLREKFFDKYKNATHSILYVVDSVTVQKEIRDVAEYLYIILTDDDISCKISSLVIICNKQDLPLAKGSSPIRQMLEKELNTLRKTKSSQLESVDPNTKQKGFLGNEKEDFAFSHLSCKVNFVEISAKGQSEDGNDLKELQNLINAGL